MNYFTLSTRTASPGFRKIWLGAGLAIAVLLLGTLENQASSRPHSSGPKPHPSSSTHGSTHSSVGPNKPVKSHSPSSGKGTASSVGKGLGDGYGTNLGGGFGAPGRNGSFGGGFGGMGGGFAGNGNGPKPPSGIAGMGGGLSGYGARGSFAGNGGQFGHFGNLGGQFGHYGNLGGQFGLQGGNVYRGPYGIAGGPYGIGGGGPVYGIAGGPYWGGDGGPLFPPGGNFVTPPLGVFGTPPYGIFGAPPSVNFGQFGSPYPQTPSLGDLIRQVVTPGQWSGNPYEASGMSPPSFGKSDRSPVIRSSANPPPSGLSSVTWSGWGGMATMNGSGSRPTGAAAPQLTRSALEKSDASAPSKSTADSKKQADAKTGKDPKPPGNSGGAGANGGYANSGGGSGLGGGQTGGHGKPGKGGQGGGTNSYNTPEPPAKYKTDKERNLWYQAFQKSWNDGQGPYTYPAALQEADSAVDQMLAAEAAAAEKQAQNRKQPINLKPDFAPNGKPLGGSTDGGTGSTTTGRSDQKLKRYDNGQDSNNSKSGGQDSPGFWESIWNGIHLGKR